MYELVTTDFCKINRKIEKDPDEQTENMKIPERIEGTESLKALTGVSRSP
jgi:hypothetical protein